MEELLVVLHTLGTTSMAGVGADTWLRLSADEQDLALTVARNGLQARGLLRLDDQGQIRVHRALLSAVGVCAYPQRTAIVDYWWAGAEATRISAHNRGDERVVHSVDHGLHTFTLLASATDVVEHLAATCEWRDAADVPLELTVRRQDFTPVCDASAAGAQDEALQLLNSASGPPEAASGLVQTLACQPRISIVQTFRSAAGQTTHEQSFTFVEGDGQAWFIAPLTEAADAPLRARTASRADVVGILRQQL